MYYDLCINAEYKERYSDFCELITSALCDKYQIFAVNTNRKGTVNVNDTNNFKWIDIKLIFQNYSLKFLNSSNIDQKFMDWDKIKILTKLTVEATDSKDFYQFSNPNNALKSYDLLAVKPIGEKMFEMCLNDLAVDIITLNLDEKFNFSVKKHLIQSAIGKNVFFEILYSDFIKDNTKRSIFISNVLQLFEVTKGKNIIISSGADNYFDHRSPFDITTLFETIFEMKTDLIKKMVSENCEKVLIKAVQRKYFKTTTDVSIQDKMVIDDNIK